MSKDDKNSSINIGVLIGIIGVLLALVGVLIAVVAWLIPFQPVGPSPFSQEQPSKPSETPTIQPEETQPNTPILPTSTPTSPPPPTNTPIPPTINCDDLVTSSRSLQLMDTGNRCWFKLFDGDSAELIFNQPAQITFAIGDGRGDRYFFIANPGDRLSDVYGATIRSMPFVNLQYGGIEQVREFETTYHNPGGGFPTCLRDWNNSNSPMTSLCQ
ncbi:MAG: hypothetical protein GY797_33980 [Deltaproteobacteria bacterium]|nr:hypothetical protein [Deltaproteobacteria bacterium]